MSMLGKNWDDLPSRLASASILFLISATCIYLGGAFFKFFIICFSSLCICFISIVCLLCYFVSLLSSSSSPKQRPQAPVGSFFIAILLKTGPANSRRSLFENCFKFLFDTAEI